MKKETFCILPWVQLATQPDGALNLCCLTSETLKADSGEELRLDTHSMEQIWGSQDLQNIRKKMLSNQKVKSCELCYQDEAHGKKSPRLMHNWTWTKKMGQAKIDELIKSSQQDPLAYAKDLKKGVTYFNFRFSNNCNLRCRMCFPMSSNGLSREFRELLEQQPSFPRFYQDILPKTDLVEWPQNEKFLTNIKATLPHLQEVYITGGEPMIGQETLEFLKMAVESDFAKNIELTFHTNTTHWNEAVARLFEKFKKVTVFCSIDGHGIVDEYVRYPTRFKKVEEVFDKYLDLTKRVPHMAVSIACSVSIYNIFSLPQLVSWYQQKKTGDKNNLVYIQFTLVHYPPFLKINLIPPSFRKRAMAALKASLKTIEKTDSFFSPSRTSLQPILDVVEKNDPAEAQDIQQFLSFQMALDTSRNQQVSNYVPEVGDIIKFYLNQNTKYSQAMFPTTYKRLWVSHLGHLVAQKNLKYLEIGSYEGQSASWVMNHILSDPSCSATLIEPFFMEGTRQRFYQNMEAQNLLPRLRVFEEPSESALEKLDPKQFDLIYIDGNHTYQAVISDAVKSWPLLKADGVMVFDDYYWMKWILPNDQRPQLAIDYFISMMGANAQVMHKGLQVFIKKRGELPASFQIPHGPIVQSDVQQKRWQQLLGPLALSALYRYHSNRIDKEFQRLQTTDPEEMYPSC